WFLSSTTPQLITTPLVLLYPPLLGDQSCVQVTHVAVGIWSGSGMSAAVVGASGCRMAVIGS
ncbi:hypothetical protein ACFV5G_42230, partial [Streptomyces sp. NPDC059766]|uniref:hypothetical protein n=1 Tax=Streptomyces sp. NPDC059766 TaxID=3346940 RepID=UPI0036499CDF